MTHSCGRWRISGCGISISDRVSTRLVLVSLGCDLWGRDAEEMVLDLQNGILHCRRYHARIPPPHLGTGVAKKHLDRDLASPGNHSGGYG